MNSPTPAESNASLTQRLKEAARAREGTVLALVIVLGLLAYRALPDSHVPLTAIAADARTPAVFDVKTLVGAGAKQRERHVRLVLADGRITAKTDGSPSPLFAVPYWNIRSIHHSHSRDPMWKSPNGPVAVARADGGVLGRFGVIKDRQWITLETDTNAGFVVLRVDDDVVRRVLKALEERTGRTPETLGRR